MIEQLVLGILQTVLGDYVSAHFREKQEIKSRAELVELVRAELNTTAEAQEQQVSALAIAVREIDAIVRRDPYLEWRDDELLEPAVRHGVRRRKVSPAEALEALERSVQERREALQLPILTADNEQPSPKEEPQPDSPAPPPVEFEFVPVEPDVSEKSPDAGEWERRVLDLGADVAAERRRRARESNS